MDRSTLHTDGWKGYETLGTEFAAHRTVNRTRKQYVDYATGASTNLAENFFSQLKRSVDGPHHNVSRTHLPRYLAKFDFRYSTRELDDTRRMARLMGQTGGRRTGYKRVRGN